MGLHYRFKPPEIWRRNKQRMSGVQSVLTTGSRINTSNLRRCLCSDSCELLSFQGEALVKHVAPKQNGTL